MKRLLLCLLLTTSALAAPAWVHQDCGIGFSIDFPKTPKACIDPSNKKTRSYSAANREWSYSFSCSPSLVDDQIAIEKMPIHLSHLANDRHAKLTLSRRVSKGRFNGFEFRIDGKGDTLEGFRLVGDGCLVEVTCGHERGNSSDARRFLDSLKVPSH